MECPLDAQHVVSPCCPDGWPCIDPCFGVQLAQIQSFTQQMQCQLVVVVQENHDLLAELKRTYAENDRLRHAAGANNTELRDMIYRANRRSAKNDETLVLVELERDELRKMLQQTMERNEKLIRELEIMMMRDAERAEYVKTVEAQLNRAESMCDTFDMQQRALTERLEKRQRDDNEFSRKIIARMEIALGKADEKNETLKRELNLAQSVRVECPKCNWELDDNEDGLLGGRSDLAALAGVRPKGTLSGSTDLDGMLRDAELMIREGTDMLNMAHNMQFARAHAASPGQAIPVMPAAPDCLCQIPGEPAPTFTAASLKNQDRTRTRKSAAKGRATKTPVSVRIGEGAAAADKQAQRGQQQQQQHQRKSRAPSQLHRSGGERRSRSKSTSKSNPAKSRSEAALPGGGGRGGAGRKSKSADKEMTVHGVQIKRGEEGKKSMAPSVAK